MSTWNVGKRMERRWNVISRIQQTSPSCMKMILLFSINNQCQPTKLLKSDSSMNEPRDYLLIVNFLINCIDESCIHRRILMISNESRSILKQELSFDKLI